MVKYAGGFCFGDDHECAESRSFNAVGRRILNFEFIAALSLGYECGCSAAVAVYCRDASEVYHRLCKFIARHTDGIRCLTTVDNKQNNIAVSLDTYSRSGSTRACCMIGCAVNIHAVLHKNLESGGCLPLVAVQRHRTVSDFRFAVLCQHKVCLCDSLMVNYAVDDEHTYRLIACPREVCIDGTYDIHAELFRGCFCLFRGRLRSPVVRIHISVTGKKLYIGIAEIDFHCIAYIAVVAGFVVQNECLFRNARGNQIGFLRDNTVIAVCTCAEVDTGGKNTDRHCSQQHENSQYRCQYF